VCCHPYTLPPPLSSDRQVPSRDISTTETTKYLLLLAYLMSSLRQR
jgi:hypothetical protein